MAWKECAPVVLDQKLQFLHAKAGAERFRAGLGFGEVQSPNIPKRGIGDDQL